MMKETLPPTQNILLGSIPESELDLLLRGSKIVALGAVAGPQGFFGIPL